MKGVINAKRRERRLNGERDTDGKEQKKKIREQIQQQSAWERQSDRKRFQGDMRLKSKQAGSEVWPDEKGRKDGLGDYDV